MKLTAIEREFLFTVRDNGDMTLFLKKNDIGYGWAINAGLITKHPAYFEFYLTSDGLRLTGGSDAD